MRTTMMDNTFRWSLIVFLLATPGALAAPPQTAGEIAKLDAQQLEALFVAGTVPESPSGYWYGRVLIRTDVRCGRMRARLASSVWKGKVFLEDGSFINQWLGFRAVTSCVTQGTSWLDGQPCLVLEYPANAAVFSNARDEMRTVAPGLILGRFYERCPCPRHQGYFLLECTEATPCRCAESCR